MDVQRPFVMSFVLAALAAPAVAGVIVVDAAGGGAFTQIQPAIDAAAEGDTILVKPGSYSAFTVDGKSLTVVGEAGTVPVDVIAVRIQNLALGQKLTLARVHAAGGTSDATATALQVTDCAGAVRIVDCEFKGRNGTTALGPGAGAYVWKASDLALSSCTMLGGYGKSGFTCFFDFVSGGASGLINSSSSIAASDCIIGGGHGGDGGDRTGSGGVGIIVNTDIGPGPSAFLFAGRSNIHGGSGGNTDCPMYGCPNDGGGGLAMASNWPTSTVTGWILDAMVVGGSAGVAFGDDSFHHCPADSGEPYPQDDPFLFSASSLGFSIPAVAREGQFVTATFTGLPGSRVFLNDELTTTFEGVASWRGVLLSPFPRAAGPSREIKWGIIPSSGVLTHTYAVPALPPGEQAQTRFLQAYRVGANGITLGSFKTLTVLDSSL